MQKIGNIEIISDAKRLLPNQSDLSFYNWNTHTSKSTDSPNFSIIPDYDQGLLFKNKTDRKVFTI